MDGLRKFNELPVKIAQEQLLRCCGCALWAKAMAARRPFADINSLLAAADEIWNYLGRPQRLEAFSHHPRIGDEEGLRKKYASTRAWAAEEQVSVAGATDAVQDELAQSNRRYEQKFGYIFIVHATGKSAEQMLVLLNERLKNEEEAEIKIAAAEQAEITKIRLEKLINQ